MAVFGGGALGGVHGDRVSVVDVLAQVVVAEDGSGLIPDAYREQWLTSVSMRVTFQRCPLRTGALATGSRLPCGRRRWWVVAAGDDDVADSMRCRRALATVGASSPSRWRWMRWLGASATSQRSAMSRLSASFAWSVVQAVNASSAMVTGSPPVYAAAVDCGTSRRRGPGLAGVPSWMASEAARSSGSRMRHTPTVSAPRADPHIVGRTRRRGP